MTYTVFSQFYDAIMGERPEAVAIMQRLLAKYVAPKADLLELACGTGAMMVPLSNNYHIDGLDLSDDMLTLAQQKLPASQFFHGDMSHFDLSKEYDGIYCVYDSINHVTAQSGWGAIFESAASHLVSGGYFIFDMNTLGRLQKISREPAYAHEFDNNYLFMKIHDQGKHIFDFDIRIFEQITADNYQLHQETIPETAYTLDVVISTLKRQFYVLETILTDGSPATDDADERVYMVCQKK